MIENQKYRRNSFAVDYGAKDDDFILADLNLMRDEEELSPVPLNHFMDDEDVIDRLLVGAHDTVEDDQDPADGKPEALVLDDISLADELADIDEITAEEDAIDRLLVNTGFDDIQHKDDMATDQTLLDSENSKLAFEQEEESDLMVQEDDADTDNEKQAKPELVFDSLNNPEKSELNVSGTEQVNIQKLIKAYEHNAKKAAVMTYASLGIGLVALLSAVIMGAVVFGMHNKVAKLSDLVSIIEEDMSSIAGKNSDLDISNNAASIEQLNQKLNGLPESLEEQVSTSTDISGNERAGDVKKQEDVNKSLDNPQSKSPVPENKKPAEASAKKLSTEKKEPVERPLLKQSLPSADGSKNKITPVAEKPATAKKANDKQQTKTMELENKKSSEATVKKLLSAEKKAGKTQATAGWSVNLNAYEDQSYAKNKAAKYSQKGIPVKVIAVDMNNAKWYRLKVGGFKSKEEATAYAAKIKKSLNLNSVSVVDK